MHAEVQLFEKPETMNCLETIFYIFGFHDLYSKFSLNVWFLDFKKLNFSMRFPLEFDDRFGLIRERPGSFTC